MSNCRVNTRCCVLAGSAGNRHPWTDPFCLLRANRNLLHPYLPASKILHDSENVEVYAHVAPTHAFLVFTTELRSARSSNADLRPASKTPRSHIAQDKHSLRILPFCLVVRFL